MAEVVEQLIEVMNDELLCQRDLAGVLENKLDAIRHHDLSRLRAAGSVTKKKSHP